MKQVEWTRHEIEHREEEDRDHDLPNNVAYALGLKGVNKFHQAADKDHVLTALDQALGHEIKKTRPALVLQNDVSNRYGLTTIVAAITSKISTPPYPNEVVIQPYGAGLEVASTIRLDQIRTVDRQRLIKRLGKVDAEVEPDLPQRWIRGEGTVERLFPEFEQEEKNYYKRTSIFPIMHPVVIKKEILERDPWVATSLYEALLASRKAYNEFMEQPHRLSFAWGRSYLEEERRFFGKDPFYQGLKENHNDVENLIKFADQQGMLGRKLSVEELFTADTRST
jgi:mRNA-degrading endonuclease toxin of MazEF toxin-antitoxin module